MGTHSREEAAERASIGLEALGQLEELGILSSDAEGRFTGGQVRQAALVAAHLSSAHWPG